MTRMQIFLRVLMWHVLVIGAFLLLPLLKFLDFFPKKEQIITVDLASLPLPPPPPEVDEQVEEDEAEEEAFAEATPVPVPTATPRPTPTPAPEATAAPTSTPVPTATPKPTPRPTPTPKSTLSSIEKIRQRIENEQNLQPVEAAPTLSPQQIEAMMGVGLPSVGGTGSSVAPSNGGNVNFGGVSSELYKRLFVAWEQPTHLSGAAGLGAVASVKVLKSGNIGSTRLVRKSGNAEYDATVLKALSSVKFAKALPDSYDGHSRTFEIEFKLSQ